MEGTINGLFAIVNAALKSEPSIFTSLSLYIDFSP